MPGSAVPLDPSALFPPLTRTLLVVDDHAGVRLSLAFSLGGAGYEVVTADSGRAALALLETATHPIDGALLDVHMPGMNGFQAAAALVARAAALGRPPPRVWFMTGAASADLERRCAELGAAPALRKPFDLPALLVRLALDLASPPPGSVQPLRPSAPPPFSPPP